MGVWRRSAIGREIARSDPGLVTEYGRVLPGWINADVVGSPYCIQAYEPDERMGGWRGLDTARRELQNRGVSLLLDFVPNHTAFDHGWVDAFPERYVLGSADDYQQTPADFRVVTIRRAPGLHRVRTGSSFPTLDRCRAAELLQSRDPGRHADDARNDCVTLRRRAMRHGDAGAQ